MVAEKSQKNAAADTVARGEQHVTNPAWFKPVMFGFMLVGLAWIITYYVSQAQLPIAPLAQWNILIGFGLMFVGFVMTTRWH
ncbi:MAG: hypothetical protein RL431_132 [Actinomycetota bacterium]|jgi:uncharacterized membrane protein (DUF485 family)